MAVKMDHPELNIGSCRSWLFIGGSDAEQHNGETFSADVLILELEDFTPPSLRPRARERSSDILSAWREKGAVPAVRVNPFSDGGHDDLVAVMAGAPKIVMLPKVSTAEDIVILSAAILELEKQYGIPTGATHVVPNIESARALFATHAIAGADPRVVACLLASEDLTADLGAPRSKDGTELSFARSYFHAACVASGVLSIDYPYTFTDEPGLRESCDSAKALGFAAKSAVFPSHAAIVNFHFTP